MPIEEHELDDAPYRSWDELVAHARALSIHHFARPAARCGRGHPATRTLVEYATAHGRSGGELIIRVRRRWHGAEIELPQLRPEDRAQVARDALLRAAHLAIGRGAAGAPVVAEAAQILAGDPELLEFVVPLCSARLFEVAEALAAAHLARRPGDPVGLVALAGATISAVEAGHHPGPLLLRAALQLDEALRRRPGFADAAALRERIATVRIAIEDPAAALTQIDDALALRGDDASLHLQRARALLALGRLRDAQKAVGDARALAPRHPDLAELTLAVARARVAAP